MLTLLELPLDLTDLTDCLDMVDTVEALRVTEAECCLLGMLDTVDCLLGRGLVWGNIGMVGIALLKIRDDKFSLLWGEAQFCLPYDCL